MRGSLLSICGASSCQKAEAQPVAPRDEWRKKNAAIHPNKLAIRISRATDSRSMFALGYKSSCIVDGEWPGKLLLVVLLIVSNCSCSLESTQQNLLTVQNGFLRDATVH